MGGCLDLSISLVCYGPRHTHPYLEQLLPASPHSPTRRQVDPSLARGHVSPRPSAICDVASSSPLKPTTPAVTVTGAGDAHGPTAQDHHHHEKREDKGEAEDSESAAHHLCPAGARIGNVEPFRLWDADLCSSRRPRPPAFMSAMPVTLPVEPDDPPPLFFYSPPPEDGAHLTHLPIDPFHAVSPPKSMLSQREHWREPGIAKVPLGRSKSASPVRWAGRSRTPGRRR